MLIFQSAVVAAEGKIMLNLFAQNKLGVFQGLVGHASALGFLDGTNSSA